MFVQITVSFDETTTLEDVDKLFKVFSGGKPVSIPPITSCLCFKIESGYFFRQTKAHATNVSQVNFTAASLAPEVQSAIPSGLVRDSPYLTHQIFNSYEPSIRAIFFFHDIILDFVAVMSIFSAFELDTTRSMSFCVTSINYSRKICHYAIV